MLLDAAWRGGVEDLSLCSLSSPRRPDCREEKGGEEEWEDERKGEKRGEDGRQVEGRSV